MKRECFCCGNYWDEEVMHHREFPLFDVEMWVCTNCEQSANIIKRKLMDAVMDENVKIRIVEMPCPCPECTAEREAQEEPTPKIPDKDKKEVKIVWDE